MENRNVEGCCRNAVGMLRDVLPVWSHEELPTTDIILMLSKMCYSCVEDTVVLFKDIIWM